MRKFVIDYSQLEFGRKTVTERILELTGQIHHVGKFSVGRISMGTDGPPGANRGGDVPPNKPPVEMFYPYNEMSQEYGEPRAGRERAQHTIDQLNQYKGGHWVIHTKDRYDAWMRKELARKDLTKGFKSYGLSPAKTRPHTH